jgi:thiol-disulfide isomerase/thioredoxin
MRTILIITFIAALAVITGCGSARKAATVTTVTAGAGESDTVAQAERVPEIAPFGNAALAGKPDNEVSDHVWDFRDATTWLLGDIKPAMLAGSPHSEWYMKGYSEYQPDQEVLAELMALDKDELSITIVLGTWCPDSRREVPRFMKIADLWGFPHDKIRLIGVDINKVAPLEDYSQLGIERVPTFIFYKNNIEKGRIIEVPVTSLEQDTENILKGN